MRVRDTMFRVIVTGAALALVACGGKGTEPRAPVSSVTLSRDTASLVANATLQLTATPKDASGNALSRQVTWTSSHLDRATVSSSGLVTGLTTGTATITATSEGQIAQAVITVKEGAIVGAAGTTITALNGVVTLIIPAGAVSSNTMITVESAANPPADSRLVAATAVNLGPSGLTFAQPVDLRIKYAVQNLPVGPPERLLGIYKAVGPSWQAMSGSEVDLVSKLVKAKLTGFSIYAVLSPPIVASVTVIPATVTVGVNQTQQLTATARDANGSQLDQREVVWTSSNPSVATVGPTTGIVTGVATGTATITATIEGKTGTATVTVGVDPCSIGNAETINIGQTVNGTLAATDCRFGDGSYADAYRLVITAVTTVRIDMTSSAFDPYLGLLNLLNSQLLFVAEDDNGGGGTSARIQRTLAAGTYYVIANSALPASFGAYQLSITQEATAPVATVTVTPATASVGVGRTTVLTATLRDANGNVLNGRTITWTSSNTAIATVTDAGVVRGVAEGGPVTITATAEGQSGTAAVAVVPASQDPCAVATGITLGQTVNGNLASTDCRLTDGSYADFYSLTLAAATTVRIDLSSTAFDSYLFLLNSQGSVIAQDDDTGGNSNARIVQALAAGTYFIVANSYDPNSFGPYQLSVVAQTSGSIARSSAMKPGKAVVLLEPLVRALATKR